MKKRARLIAACGAALLVVALVFSVFFVAAEADHHCSGEHCSVCQQIQICQRLLEQLSTACTPSAGAAAFCFVVLLLLLYAQNIVAASSPVLLRVKLLN